MRTLNLTLADLVIKVLFAVYCISLLIGIGVFLVWFMNGNAVHVDKQLSDTSEVIFMRGKSSPIQSVLHVKDIFVFSIPLIVEGLIMIYILIKSSKILKHFKSGIIFNSTIADQVKSIANWIIILVITKISLRFILEMITFKKSNFGFSSDYLMILLFMGLIYITADIIKKGADLKSENDLTI